VIPGKWHVSKEVFTLVLLVPHPDVRGGHLKPGIVFRRVQNCGFSSAFSILLFKAVKEFLASVHYDLENGCHAKRRTPVWNRSTDIGWHYFSDMSLHEVVAVVSRIRYILGFGETESTFASPALAGPFVSKCESRNRLRLLSERFTTPSGFET